MKRLVPETGLELIGSPFPGIVGDTKIYNINLGGTVVIDASSFFHAWKGTTSVTSSVCPGSMSATGNILTTPTISGEVAAEYRYVFKVLVDGAYRMYYFRRRVERESGSKL